MKKPFLIIGNARTGSTWLLTGLGLVPGIFADYEIKIKEYEGDIYKIIGRDGSNVREIIESMACAEDVVGSKLVFNAYVPKQDEINSLSDVIDPDIAVIHLRRSLWAQLLSALGREFIHVLHNPDESRARESSPLFRSLKNQTEKYGGKESLAIKKEMPSESRLVAQAACLAMWDLVAVGVARRVKRSMTVDYADIPEKFMDIAAFVGGTCTAERAREIIENPVTKKLPPLDDDMMPNAEVLKRVCETLDQDIERVARNEIPIETIWPSNDRLEFSHLKVDWTSGAISLK